MMTLVVGDALHLGINLDLDQHWKRNLFIAGFLLRALGTEVHGQMAADQLEVKRHLGLTRKKRRIMKHIFLALLTLPLLGGCVSPKIVRELAKDNAHVDLHVRSPWVSLDFTRSNPPPAVKP